MFAGLSYKLTETISSGLPESLMFYNSTHWVPYVHRLVTHMYGDPDVANAARDALSPFQVVSKRWAACVASVVGKRDYVIIGSWFGQLVPMLLDENPEFEDANGVLVDVDGGACAISSECLQAYTKLTHTCLDVFELYPVVLAGHLVFWPGLEHFDKTKVSKLLHKLEGTNTYFVLLATDRPEEDHTAEYRHVEDVTQYFHTEDVLFKGTLSTKEGNRFMVVARN